jgi:protein-disulfide isomerase
VEAEAKKRGLTLAALLSEEVDRKVKEPTDAEVEAFYLGQRDRLNKPFEQVKSQLAKALKQIRLVQARQEYGKQIRDRAEVAVLLQPPRIHVAVDPKRFRGKSSAPVQIVEFSDFQCPYCGSSEATVRQLLEKYGDQVALSYRDFPLKEIHPNAEGAAEAARCAADQGKFWEYHDRIFEKQTSLDKSGLTDLARNIGLDVSKFDSCISAGRYKAAIEQDRQQGTAAGVSGTPAFFINGIFLNGAQPALAFEKIIDAELARTQAARVARSQKQRSTECGHNKSTHLFSGTITG